MVPDMEGGLDMPGFSPDGKRLVLVSYRGPGLRSQIWSYTLPSGPLRQLTETPEGAYDPAWSPDGARIAYAARSRGRHDLWVMGADGTDARQITENGASRCPCWSPDGQHLAYVSGQAGRFELWVAPAPPAPSAAAASEPVSPRVPEPAASAARQLSRGAQIDPVSGLTWTR
jgi:TolB protein